VWYENKGAGSCLVLYGRDSKNGRAHNPKNIPKTDAGSLRRNHTQALSSVFKP
jgi:hypothetical protein